MKKVLSLLLALIMVVVLAVPAFASQPTPQPRWSYATIISPTLYASGSFYYIGGSAYSIKGYTVNVTAQLEKLSGGSWESVTGFSFTGSGTGSAAAGGYRSLAAGTYRTHVYVTIYNSSGYLVESISTECSAAVTV